MLTNSLSVIALNESAKTVNVELESIGESLIKVATYGQSEITYAGKKILCFGVQVMELKYMTSENEVEKRFTFASAKDMQNFRGNISGSFIGDKEHGSVFIDGPS
jgi:hypothetical protein